VYDDIVFVDEADEEEMCEGDDEEEKVGYEHEHVN